MAGFAGLPDPEELARRVQAAQAAKADAGKAANVASQGGINNPGNGVSDFNPNDKTGIDMGSSAAVRGQQSGDQQDYNNTTYGGQATVYDANGRVIRRSSANIEADRALENANAAQGRLGAQVDNADQRRDYGKFEGQMGLSDQSRGQQQQAYGRQMDATDRYGAMARGEGPSLASALMGQGMNNIRAQQTSAAASARGPAGLAMAQQQAAGNMAAQGQQLNAQLGQMRNQEQMQAMQGYAQGAQGLSSAAGAMRGQDQTGAQLYGQQRGISTQNDQANAQLQQNQNALNDQRSMGYEQLRSGIYSQGVTNNLNRETMQRAGRQEAAASGDSDTDQMARYIGTGASVLGSIAFMSDVNNKTDISPIDAGGSVDAKTAGKSLSGALGALGNGMSKKGDVYKQPSYLMNSKPGDRSGTPYQSLSKGDADVFSPGKVQDLNSGAVSYNTPTAVEVGGGAPIVTDTSEFGGPMDTSSVAMPVGQVGAPTGQPSRLDFGKMEAPVVPANASPDPAFNLSMPGLGSQMNRPMYSDEKLKKDTVSLAEAAKMDPDSRMLFGRDDKVSNEARRMFSAQEAMYGSKSPIQDTLRTTQPYAFNYKDGVGEDPNQRHVGIMAQDLERTPAGSTLVKEGPKGKMIDGKQAIGFSLAAAADLQKQVDRQNAEIARMKAMQGQGVIRSGELQLASPGVGAMRVADQGPVGPNEAYTRTKYVPIQPEPYVPMRPRRTMDGDY